MTASQENRDQNNDNRGGRRGVFLVVIFLILILLLLFALLVRSGILDLSSFTGGQGTPTAIADDASSDDDQADGEDSTGGTANTPTATRVLQNGDSEEDADSEQATPTPAADDADSSDDDEDDEASSDGDDDDATATPRPDSVTDTIEATETPTPEAMEVQIVNLLRNGNFEQGVNENDGVARHWNPFHSKSAKIFYIAEPWPLAINDGDVAQRMTIYEAYQPDQYAGIYQTVNVIPGESYRLRLFGQIRSKAGSVEVSSYGYRMQYAVDWSGRTNWREIPNEEWIELPWDEQLIDSATVEYLNYSTTLVPPRSKMTLFIRGLNRWPDPVEAQYTLDTLSLIGAAPANAMVDQPLPDTGQGTASLDFLTDPRVWASILFLIFLIGSAVWRNRYSHRSIR